MNGAERKLGRILDQARRKHVVIRAGSTAAGLGQLAQCVERMANAHRPAGGDLDPARLDRDPVFFVRERGRLRSGDGGNRRGTIPEAPAKPIGGGDQPGRRRYRFEHYRKTVRNDAPGISELNAARRRNQARQQHFFHIFVHGFFPFRHTLNIYRRNAMSNRDIATILRILSLRSYQQQLRCRSVRTLAGTSGRRTAQTSARQSGTHRRPTMNPAYPPQARRTPRNRLSRSPRSACQRHSKNC
ncbi:hypothetical protein SDC9_161350 [bioreactor metagenome]|uniref:Uncharacterized protein n=1 Tax=bioreactor metagenome TaxID=1076179 RepID=A0A645FP67_9ZZZZ